MDNAKLKEPCPPGMAKPQHHEHVVHIIPITFEDSLHSKHLSPHPAGDMVISPINLDAGDSLITSAKNVTEDNSQPSMAPSAEICRNVLKDACVQTEVDSRIPDIIPISPILPLFASFSGISSPGGTHKVRDIPISLDFRPDPGGIETCCGILEKPIGPTELVLSSKSMAIRDPAAERYAVPTVETGLQNVNGSKTGGSPEDSHQHQRAVKPLETDRWAVPEQLTSKDASGSFNFIPDGSTASIFPTSLLSKPRARSSSLSSARLAGGGGTLPKKKVHFADVPQVKLFVDGCCDFSPPPEMVPLHEEMTLPCKTSQPEPSKTDETGVSCVEPPTLLKEVIEEVCEDETVADAQPQAEPLQDCAVESIAPCAHLMQSEHQQAEASDACQSQAEVSQTTMPQDGWTQIKSSPAESSHTAFPPSPSQERDVLSRLQASPSSPETYSQHEAVTHVPLAFLSSETDEALPTRRLPSPIQAHEPKSVEISEPDGAKCLQNGVLKFGTLPKPFTFKDALPPSLCDIYQPSPLKTSPSLGVDDLTIVEFPWRSELLVEHTSTQTIPEKNPLSELEKVPSLQQDLLLQAARSPVPEAYETVPDSQQELLLRAAKSPESEFYEAVPKYQQELLLQAAKSPMPEYHTLSIETATPSTSMETPQKEPDTLSLQSHLPETPAATVIPQHHLLLAGKSQTLPVANRAAQPYGRESPLLVARSVRESSLPPGGETASTVKDKMSPTAPGLPVRQPLRQKSPEDTHTDALAENKHKSVFVDSAFYSPNEHPTLEEQVALASQISSSLSDDTNRNSRGQSMYEKRKKRSPKWVHQDVPHHQDRAVCPDEQPKGGRPLEAEDYLPSTVTPKSKPLLKLVMSGRGQELDLEALRSQGLVIADQEGLSPEVCSDIVRDLHASNGKGGQIFAKRKKRSEKWVVDDLHPEPRRPGERPTTELITATPPRQQLMPQSPAAAARSTSPEPEVPPVRLSQLITSPQAPKFPTDGVYSPRLAQGWGMQAPHFPAPATNAVSDMPLPDSDMYGTASDTVDTVADSEVTLEPPPRCVLSDSIEESLRLMSEKRHQRATGTNYNTAARGWDGVGFYYTPMTFDDTAR